MSCEELNECRLFLETVANLAQKSANDEVSISRTLPYQLVAAEVVGEFVSCSLQYLTETKCPPKLIATIINNVVETFRSKLSDYLLLSGSNSNPKTYNPVNLKHLATSSIQAFCQRLLDNIELNKILRFTYESENNSVRLRSISGATRNRRRFMEDRHICIDEFNLTYNIENCADVCFYAVFDGHDGIYASSYSSVQLPYLLATQKYLSLKPVEALRQAFLETDNSFIEKSVKGGSTAVCALYFPQTLRLYIAWVGDSKALLAKQGKIMQIVQSHKPEDPKEKKRICDAGGSVIKWEGVWRVDGLINLSRAIGDARCKPYLTAEPDVVGLQLDKNEDFLVLASDGLWDHVQEEEVALLVYENIQVDNENLKKIPEILINKARDCGSSDNITVVIVFFKNPCQITKFSNNIETMNSAFGDYNTGELSKTSYSDQAVEANANIQIDLNNYASNQNAQQDLQKELPSKIDLWNVSQSAQELNEGLNNFLLTDVPNNLNDSKDFKNNEHNNNSNQDDNQMKISNIEENKMNNEYPNGTDIKEEYENDLGIETCVDFINGVSKNEDNICILDSDLCNLIKEDQEETNLLLNQISPTILNDISNELITESHNAVDIALSSDIKPLTLEYDTKDHVEIDLGEKNLEEEKDNNCSEKLIMNTVTEQFQGELQESVPFDQIVEKDAKTEPISKENTEEIDFAEKDQLCQNEKYQLIAPNADNDKIKLDIFASENENEIINKNNIQNSEYAQETIDPFDNNKNNYKPDDKQYEDTINKSTETKMQSGGLEKDTQENPAIECAENNKNLGSSTILESLSNDKCDESDDEWNYMRIKEGQGEKQETEISEKGLNLSIDTALNNELDLNEKNEEISNEVEKNENKDQNSSLVLEPLNEINFEDIAKTDDINYQLNPDAKEFIPTSPPNFVKITKGYPKFQQPLEDDVVAQSPRKPLVNMENIQVPEEEMFDKEAAERPHEVARELILLESKPIVSDVTSDDENKNLSNEKINQNIENSAEAVTFLNSDTELITELNKLEPNDSIYFQNSEFEPVKDETELLNHIQIIPDEIKDASLTQEIKEDIEKESNLSEVISELLITDTGKIIDEKEIPSDAVVNLMEDMEKLDIMSLEKEIVKQINEEKKDDESNDASQKLPSDKNDILEKKSKKPITKSIPIKSNDVITSTKLASDKAKPKYPLNNESTKISEPRKTLSKKIDLKKPIRNDRDVSKIKLQSTITTNSKTTTTVSSQPLKSASAGTAQSPKSITNPRAVLTSSTSTGDKKLATNLIKTSSARPQLSGLKKNITAVSANGKAPENTLLKNPNTIKSLTSKNSIEVKSTLSKVTSATRDKPVTGVANRISNTNLPKNTLTNKTTSLNNNVKVKQTKPLVSAGTVSTGTKVEAPKITPRTTITARRLPTNPMKVIDASKKSTSPTTKMVKKIPSSNIGNKSATLSPTKNSLAQSSNHNKIDGVASETDNAHEKVDCVTTQNENVGA